MGPITALVQPVVQPVTPPKLKSIKCQPRAGELAALKTTLEIRPGDALVEVYVTKVPPKAANGILSSVRSLYVNTASIDLQHLRKFAKAAQVPQDVLADFEEPTTGFDTSPTASLYLLVGPIAGVSVQQLVDHLAVLLPDGVDRDDVLIWTTVVPLLAPTSAAQATEFSEQYWPTVYKKSNPFGPHPAILERALLEITEDAPKFFGMLAELSKLAVLREIGLPVSALIVDRTSGHPQIISMAADARWEGQNDCSKTGPGNVMAHAVLRAIGMVAQKLKRTGDKYAARRDQIRDEHERQVFSDRPLLAPEQEISDLDNISMDGYLCHGLEIYVTHEPCIMCSMAILHSRFARVVFGQRMSGTGGLSSESDNSTNAGNYQGLGYGLFWRKELNWSLLGWEYKQKKIDPMSVLSPTTHA